MTVKELACNENEVVQTVQSKERWSREQIGSLFALPFHDLMFRAQQVHREHFNPNEIQRSSLLSIKTGGCTEDCSYCAQSTHHNTGVQASKLLDVDAVRAAALQARDAGATRFCMAAAWREPKDRDIEKVAELVKAVKALDMQACCSLGMLTLEQAQALKEAGLDYYNHNLDTAPEDYERIISTRDYQNRLDTLDLVRETGMRVCCGGIIGMGEKLSGRIGLLHQIANMEPYPESIPINHLARIEGTPLEHKEPLDPFDFVRTIAVARIIMPKAWVRLSAGRKELGEGVQALCFLAGANSIFYGDQLLITGNPDWAHDQALMKRLDLTSSPSVHARLNEV